MRPDQAPGVVEAAYDSIAERYERWAASYPDPGRERMVARLVAKLSPGARVADLGCGNGAPTAVALARFGFVVIGIDRSREQLRRAARRVPAIRADLGELPVRAASLDGAVAIHSWTHLPAAMQADAVQAGARTLRPGGWLLAALSAKGGGDWTGEWLGAVTHFGSCDPAQNREHFRLAALQIHHDEVDVLDEPEGPAPVHWLLAQRAH